MPYSVSTLPASTRLGTLAGRMETDSMNVPKPTASASPMRPRDPSGSPARSATASTIGISTAMRPMLEGITNASA